MWTSLHHPNNACDDPKVVIIHKLHGYEFIPVVETNLTAKKPLSSGVVLENRTFPHTLLKINNRWRYANG